MSRFNELNKNTSYVLNLLMQNQNLMKLLYYNDEDPLSMPTITDPSILLFNNIYPYPKIIPAITEQKSLLNFVFSNAKLSKDNFKFKTNKLIFYIICHSAIWPIKNGIRPYMISSEIDSIFSGIRGTPLSMGKVLFGDWIYREFSEYFCGYMCTYDLSEVS